MRINCNLVRLFVAGLIAVPAASAVAVLKPEPFSPIMASFSNELEFDALRGPVKSFEQALYTRDEKPIMFARGSFDQKGCLNNYEKLDGVNNGKIKLVRNTKDNTLVSEYDKTRVLYLTDNCEVKSVAGQGSEPKQYVYDKGFLVKVKGLKDAWVYKEYFYTQEGMPKSTVYYGDEKDVLVITEPKKKLSDNWDFITEGLNDGQPVFQSVKKCEYDERYNPKVCYLITATVNDGVQTKKVELLRYWISYY